MSIHRKLSLFFLITAAPILAGCSPNESVIGRVGARLAVPGGRYLHTAVWTGSEMIVWGGSGFPGPGWRYDPGSDSWTPISTTDEPSAREFHTAVWTGSEMIVWGGRRVGIDFNNGGRYNPATDSWTPTSTINAPSPRVAHRAFWTGSEMIVWGGYDDAGGVSLNTGGRYDPATDSWTPTNLDSAPNPRTYYTAVWTGGEMIVWGGIDIDLVTVHNSGGRYDPATNRWTATDATQAPAARYRHSAVWTGSEMIVWGGDSRDGNRNDGGRYDLASDSWAPTNTIGAPSPRDFHTAVWSGTEMMLWGGEYYDGIYHYLNTGGRYLPTADTWSLTEAINAPSGRYLHTAVWTGSQMIVWGGADDTTTFNTGGRYDPAGDTWMPTRSGGE